MINHGIQYSTSQPPEIEMTEQYVFIATNIEPYSKEIEDHVVSGYQYNYKQYTKDEYLLMQGDKIAELSQELAAAKILLGVD